MDPDLVVFGWNVWNATSCVATRQEPTSPGSRSDTSLLDFQACPPTAVGLVAV